MEITKRQLQDEEVTAYHGGPHSFDKFSTQYMGTGEGNQSFGWGLYFTDLEDIARDYANRLYDKSKLEEINKRLSEISKELDKYQSGEYGKYNSPIGYKLKKEYDDLINSRQNEIRKNKTLYKVSLHKGKTPEQYTWLEWDGKPNENLIERLNLVLNKRLKDSIQFINDKYGGKIKNGAIVYKAISRILGGDKEASLFLLENGIDGIKYPTDSLSRGATSYNTSGFNYVVFDENAVTIEKQTQLEEMEVSKKDLIQNKKLKEDAEDVNFMGEITKGELEEAKKARTKLRKKKKADRCTRIAKRKYDVWPSAYSSAAVVRCRQGDIWTDLKEEETTKGKIHFEHEHLDHYSGQDNYELGIYEDDEVIGYVQYVIFENEITVSDILVRPNRRRENFGSMLIKKMKQLHPNAKYKPSMKTDLGSKFIHKDVDINESKNENMQEPEYALIEIIKPLAYMDLKYYYQLIPKLKLNNRLIDIKKGASGTKSISPNNVKVIETGNKSELETKLKELQNVGEKMGSRKQKQLDIINKTNPAPNDQNTWIRNIEDILSPEEAFKDDDNFIGTPDFRIKDAKEALKNGEIIVYSSYPIKNGVFVTPSKMEATLYAGNKTPYSKKVKLTDVAWIDSNEGQYAEVNAAEQSLDEKWSKKYKGSIDCNNPKGFSQKAHCKGRLKEEEEFGMVGVDQLEKELLDKYKGLKTLFLSASNGVLSIDMIEINLNERKKGIGSNVMNDIIEYADANNMEIQLNPALKDERKGTTSRNRLVRFYKNFGFIENTGRNIDYRKKSGSMYRLPKSVQQLKEEEGSVGVGGNVEGTAKALADIAKKNGITTPDDFGNASGGALMEIISTADLMDWDDMSKSDRDALIKTIPNHFKKLDDILSVSAAPKDLLNLLSEIKNNFIDGKYDDVKKKTSQLKKEMDAWGKKLNPNMTVSDGAGVRNVAEAYHKAKADGSNPELVKAVENALKEQSQAGTTLNEKTDFSKEKEQGLHGWFARQGGKGKSKGWVDCNTCRDGKCKSCGRKEGESRSKYPACRPTPSACKTKGKGKSWGKKSKLNEDNQYLLPEEINEVLKGYIETALWTEEERLNDEYGSEHNKVFKDYDDYEDKEDTELDKLIKLSANINNKGIEKFSKEDIEPDSLIKAYSDIKKFIQLAGDSVYEAIYENGLERLGTDIWFTRNGHGAGFFDHSYDDDDEKKLIQAGKSLGSVDLYINDNLKLSFSNQHLYEQSKQDIKREIKLNEIKNTFKRLLK